MVTSLFFRTNQIGFCQEKYAGRVATKLLKNFRGKINSKARSFIFKSLLAAEKQKAKIATMRVNKFLSPSTEAGSKLP